MEKPNFEQETISPVESEISPESLKERTEVLQGIVDEFDSELSRAIQEFESAAGTSYSSEKGYDDSLKLKNLTNLVLKLGAFESHIKSIIDLFENKDGADGLNILWSSVMDLRNQLSVAPDIRYSREAQIEKYGGESNVPGEKILDTFEHTEELILSLQAEIKGIKTALIFMKPAKILKS